MEQQVAEIRAQLETKTAGSLKKFFVKADKQQKGILRITDLEAALRETLDINGLAKAAGVPMDCVASDIARFLDLNGSGNVSYAEFTLGLHAGGLDGRWRRCLLEPMCTIIYMHRSILLQGLRRYDNGTGKVNKEDFVIVLGALGEALGELRGEVVMTRPQIDRVVENLAWDSSGLLDYEVFLKSFCVVDTGRMSECASNGWHLLQAAFSPAMHASRNPGNDLSRGSSVAESLGSRTPSAWPSPTLSPQVANATPMILRSPASRGIR